MQVLREGKVGSSWLRLWKKRGLMREFGAPVVELEGGAGSVDALLGVRTGLELLMEEAREAEGVLNLCRVCVVEQVVLLGDAGKDEALRRLTRRRDP